MPPAASDSDTALAVAAAARARAHDPHLRAAARMWLASDMGDPWKSYVLGVARLCSDVVDSVRVVDVPRFLAAVHWSAANPGEEAGMAPELAHAVFGANEEYVPCDADEFGRLLVAAMVDQEGLVDFLLQSWVPLPPGHNSKFFSDPDAAKRFQKHFERKFVGPSAKWLEKRFEEYRSYYQSNASMLSGKTIYVLQSTGTGKSKMLDELMKRIRGVSLSFRDMDSKTMSVKHTGYPIGDWPVCQFLRLLRSRGDYKGEEIAASLLGALFQVAAQKIRGANTRQSFGAQWSAPDVLQFGHSPRFRTMEHVCAAARARLDKYRHEILATRSANMPTPEPTSGHVESFTTWTESLRDILITEAADDLEQALAERGEAVMIFVLDDCSLLDYSEARSSPYPTDYMSLLALQRIIKACDAYEFWFFMLDAKSWLHGAPMRPPPEPITSSWRLMRDYDPLPPWTSLPFDVMVPPQDQLPKSPRASLEISHLQVYGRPLWTTYAPSDVIKAAKIKLTKDGQGELFRGQDYRWHRELRKQQVFAVLSARLLLYLTTHEAATQFAMEAVKSHMRVLVRYDEKRGVVKTTAPSEPILAIAAAEVLFQDNKTYSAAMAEFASELVCTGTNSIVALGERGQTIARAILIITRDHTLMGPRKYGGQLTPDGLSVRTFDLSAYMALLIGGEALHATQSATWDTFCAWGNDVALNFTHFVQMEDYIASHLSPEFLITCWRRGWALQCTHNQAVIDIILVGYTGDLNAPFDAANFVLIVVHVQCHPSAAESGVLNAMTAPFIRPERGAAWKPPFVAILMDMGTRSDFSLVGCESHRPRVSLTQDATVRGKTQWGAYDTETTTETAYRLNLRGMTPYASVKELAPALERLVKEEARDVKGWDEIVRSSFNATAGVSTASKADMQQRWEKIVRDA